MHTKIFWHRSLLKKTKSHDKEVVKVIWHKTASPPHTDGSVVFTRLCQWAPHLIRASLSPPESTPQMASRSVQPFLHSSYGVSLYFTVRAVHSPSKLPIAMGDVTPPPHLIRSSLSPQRKWHRSVQPFLQGWRLWQTDRSTDTPRYSVCNNRPHLADAAMRPNNSSNHKRCTLLWKWNSLLGQINFTWQRYIF